jgi:hypothetical protein
MTKTRSVALLFLLAIVSGCMGINSVSGSGKVITETRNVSGFTGVEVSGDAKVTVEQSDMERVEITADDNLMQYLSSEVLGSKLMLGPKNLIGLRPTERITYKIFAKNLSSLGASGSISAEAKDVKADSFNVALSGSGDIEVSGETSKQTVSISGSANYDGEHLASKEATLNISGSGKAVLAVSEKLDVQVSGSGDVEYIGAPQVTQNISGSGAIRQRK